MCTNSICRSPHHARKCRTRQLWPVVAANRLRLSPSRLRFASNTRVTLRLAKLATSRKPVFLDRDPRPVRVWVKAEQCRAGALPRPGCDSQN
jgi:hypothetical protein